MGDHRYGIPELRENKSPFDKGETAQAEGVLSPSFQLSLERGGQGVSRSYLNLNSHNTLRGLETNFRFSLHLPFQQTA